MFDALHPVDVSYAAFLADDERARQRAIRRLRAFDSGQQFVALTDRLRTFLRDPLAGTDDSALMRLNVIRTVNRAVTERLILRTFDSDDRALAQFAAAVWAANRMDARADDVHEMAIRDGEAFVLVSWDAETNLPRLTPHPRYVDGADGVHLADDGFGIRAFYKNDDDRATLLYCVKRWIEVTYVPIKPGVVERRTRNRATFYYPDRVEKYHIVAGLTLQPIQDPGDATWPLPWVDALGQPLGIPVIHFRNAGLNGEAWEAIPMQNAINKTLVDLLASSDMTAFRILVALGFDPVNDDGTPWRIEPGHWVGTLNTDATVQSIDGADLSNQLSLLDSLVMKTAQVTDTPVARFVTTKQVANSDTQKQQDAPLIGKVRKRQALLGNAWEDVIACARRLYNTFGPGGLDETRVVSAVWESADVRDDDAELARAAQKQLLGIPRTQIWRELGYTETQIAQFLAENAATPTPPAMGMLPSAPTGAAP